MNDHINSTLSSRNNGIRPAHLIALVIRALEPNTSPFNTTTSLPAQPAFASIHNVPSLSPTAGHELFDGLLAVDNTECRVRLRGEHTKSMLCISASRLVVPGCLPPFSGPSPWPDFGFPCSLTSLILWIDNGCVLYERTNAIKLLRRGPVDQLASP